ncbi:MAG: TIGR03960 family B12-binding radical SAM protein [Dehalococcoidia bacterium]|nr:TIGR03960 family B12-binding radical SAM protein [Dehalococcoidia bacterium]
MNIDRILPTVSRPGRYTGDEWNSSRKDWDSAEIRVLLSYPDVYEIGMSNLGIVILYDILNREPGVLAERVFSPWVDMEAAMRRESVPLFSLESRQPAHEFDIFGLSLGYELTYTNMLGMLDLAGLPIRARERGNQLPLVIAGGGCAFNPEPVADFIDLFVIGDGEDALIELLDVFRTWKRQGRQSKRDLLLEAARMPGIYVPAFYEPRYNPDGTLAAITAEIKEIPDRIIKRIVSSLPKPVTKPVVPYLQTVHDRAAVEIQRGCLQGCRFCQAGIIYRPVRERSQREVLTAVDELIRNCGYDEVSLLSLSSSDYPDIKSVVSALSEKYRDRALNLSLPSLRLDSSGVALADAFGDGKKAGSTFAPEAGTERLRRIINKRLTDEDILQAAETAVERGWKNLKLYFMIGLPGETMDDVSGIVHLVRKIKNVGKGRMNIRVNASTFTPKAHTPFQWVAQAPRDVLESRQQELRSGLRRIGVHLSWQAPEVSILEAVLSRGDRRLSCVIEEAWKAGCRFDAWSECFDFQRWQAAFEKCGLDPWWYSGRERNLDEILPWSHIDTGVSPGFLKREYLRSIKGVETPMCGYERCNACGLQEMNGDCRAKYREMQAKSSVKEKHAE